MIQNQTKIIIGLGNKSEEYEKTYHNVGFLFVDYWNKRQGEIVAEGSRVPTGHLPKGDNDSFMKAVKTEGFMNQSGDSVKKILKERGVKIEDTLIAHDDSDLFIGEYKISRDRGSAGHKGIDHIISVFGTKDFTRLRIGIRPKQKEGAERKRAEEFVLKNISTANMKLLQKVFEEAVALYQNAI